MSSSPYRRVTVEIINCTSWKLNFKGLERRLVAACYRYGSDNDDNQTPLTHKEHIKVGKTIKSLEMMAILWRILYVSIINMWTVKISVWLPFYFIQFLGRPLQLGQARGPPSHQAFPPLINFVYDHLFFSKIIIIIF